MARVGISGWEMKTEMREYIRMYRDDNVAETWGLIRTLVRDGLSVRVWLADTCENYEFDHRSERKTPTRTVVAARA